MGEHKQILEQKLWNIANELRGNMAAGDFRDYILGLIFYKYLSERIENLAKVELEYDNITYIEAYKDEEMRAALKTSFLESVGYFIEPDHLFHTITEKGRKREFILSDLTEAFKNIELSAMGADSESVFQGLFEDVDLQSSKLGRSESDKNKLITEVMKHIDEINFEFQNTEIDVLGDAYEYLIGQFAAGAGKKAGEFYTPQQVSKVLAKLVTVGKDRISSVYDPTCGSRVIIMITADSNDGDWLSSPLLENKNMDWCAF